MMPRYLIGVDPSFHTCGIAIYEPATTGLELFSGDSFAAYAYLNSKGILGQSVIVLENPNLDSTSFNMWGLFQKALKSGAGQAELQKQFAICMTYAQKVGQSKAAGKWFLELFLRQSIPVVEVAPSSRDRADHKRLIGANPVVLRSLKMPTKTTQEQFKILTGWSSLSNEHKRDAAMSVHGRTISWAMNAAKISEAKRDRPK